MVDSITTQTYGREHIEHIVVDGGSIDGTVKMVKEQNIDQWISEPDTGIYHAMNKGVRMARGEFIVFMNSDDFFYPQAVEASIEALLATNADYSYGNSVIYSSDKSPDHNLIKPLEHIYITVPFFFETMFIKKTCLQEMGGLDESFRIASDYDFMFRLYLQGKKGIALEDYIAGMHAGGISFLHLNQVLSEAAQIRKRYYFSQMPRNIENDPFVLSKPTAITALMTSLPEGHRLAPLIGYFSSSYRTRSSVHFFLLLLGTLSRLLSSLRKRQRIT